MCRLLRVLHVDQEPFEIPPFEFIVRTWAQTPSVPSYEFQGHTRTRAIQQNPAHPVVLAATQLLHLIRQALVSGRLDTAMSSWLANLPVGGAFHLPVVRP